MLAVFRAFEALRIASLKKYVKSLEGSKGFFKFKRRSK